MLTADYHRLGLRSGDRLLDLGCGFGRHAFEALRRGAHVVACDLGIDELHRVRATVAAMAEADEIGPDVVLETANGDATRLPFADDSFDRVIASEVMEHIHDDDAALTELTRVLRPGGTIAITVPATLPERICWKISSDYHAPAAVGGHVRIYGRHTLRDRMAAAGLVVDGDHRSHALHSPYWWLRCAVGPNRPIEGNRLVRIYHRFLTWDIVKAPRTTRTLDRILNPVLGKSLVVYATKPAQATHPTVDPDRELVHVPT
ncbi:MAG: class I SAM-dependent methyltransferase [Acidimicrobiales bacterium]|nr:class I SAM-dependent methyltransferase [Acidimicrobiales bacterium]MDP6649128.1 class I SAM-dependent methyltransferase [Acidimicrobiales bacterium]MDP6758902.1 class I SAM-dependent methyltransferase [Acidimicrobiales bacterium]